MLKLLCLFPEMQHVNIYLQNFIELKGKKGAKICDYCCYLLCNSNFRFPETQDFFDLDTLHYVLLHTSMCLSYCVIFFSASFSKLCRKSETDQTSIIHEAPDFSII